MFGKTRREIKTLKVSANAVSINTPQAGGLKLPAKIRQYDIFEDQFFGKRIETGST
jgi:hypothetical protein